MNNLLLLVFFFHVVYMFRPADSRRPVVRRFRRRGPEDVRAATGRRGQHAAVRGPVLGGAGTDHSVRGHGREGIQDGAAAVHRARHDSHRRVLLRGPHNVVLLPAHVLLQAAPAQGQRRRSVRQDGRVLQVHAVPQPRADERARRRRRAERGRISSCRVRAHDGAQTGAETRVHGGRLPATAASRLPTSEYTTRVTIFCIVGAVKQYSWQHEPNSRHVHQVCFFFYCKAHCAKKKKFTST